MDFSDNIYLYDGTFHGFLTAVFHIYNLKKEPTSITADTHIQTTLDSYVIEIETDIILAKRVEKGILSKTSKQIWQLINKAFLSYREDKEMILYRFIKQALVTGYKILSYRANTEVIDFEDMLSHIGKETHNWKGFIRFSQMEGGFFYAEFEPKNNVTALLMPHFSSRLADQPFLLHDKRRHIVGVYNLNDWYVIETDALKLPNYDEEEYQYRRMWKTFFETVSIKGRLNKKCQQQFLPHWYRANMTEFLNDEPKLPLLTE